MKECTSKCADPTGDDDTPLSKSRRSDDNSTYTGKSYLVKRDGHTVNAHNVDPEVAFISWPLRQGKQEKLGKDFVYDDTAGIDQTIYIVDTGAGLGSTDVSKYNEGSMKMANNA